MMGRVIAVPQLRKSLLRHGSGAIKVEGVPAESVRLAWRSRSPLQPPMFSFIPHLHKYKNSVSEYSFFTHQRYILYNHYFSFILSITRVRFSADLVIIVADSLISLITKTRFSKSFWIL